MKLPPPHTFQPGAPDDAGIISWVHIGDLHMEQRGEQNHRDLVAIIDQINRVFASSISFVFLPGDVAEHGKADEYAIVRDALDQLRAPWCSILGDHDVHEKTFAHYHQFMMAESRYTFDVGPVRFIGLNAFDVPDPASFCLLPQQLDWLDQQVRVAAAQRTRVALLLHCYPTDLKQGRDRLRAIIADPAVCLIDMGHTHYNEVANDGKTIYTATRSTGQIEEGPVGFSVTNIDGDAISWKFMPLSVSPAIMITSPADERFVTDTTRHAAIVSDALRVRAKAWSDQTVQRVIAEFQGQTLAMSQIAGSHVWQAELKGYDLPDGVYPLSVTAEDAEGRSATDSIRIVVGDSAYHAPVRSERDQDNPLPPWPERGLLGTQLGPNKNGRKW